MLEHSFLQGGKLHELGPRVVFPESFLEFVYRYHAAPLTSLESVDVYDFLHDHLLRKVSIRPDEYVFWPPAIRLFYRFLGEQGYIDDPTPFVRLFTQAEPEFIALLKKLY